MFDEQSAQLPLWSERDGADGWHVRESRRARRLTVRVFHGGRVEVVVPARTSRAMVERFVERHRRWIERKRTEARRTAIPDEPFPPETIEFGGVGETWRVHARGGTGRPSIKVAAPGLLQLTGDLSNTRAVQHAFRLWLVKRAAVLFAPLLERTAQTMNLPYRKLAVRRQRTRWGSCSARGTISLNCCLLFQRPEVLHYLLVHELAHVTHMNHSARFWDLVARFCPECRQLDRELLDGWRRVPSWVFRDLREPA